MIDMLVIQGYQYVYRQGRMSHFFKVSFVLIIYTVLICSIEMNYLKKIEQSIVNFFIVQLNSMRLFH